MAYQFSENTSLSYSTFFGKEAEFRHFHDVVFKTTLTNSWNIAVQADIGFQEKPSSSSYSNWYGTVLISQYFLNERTALSNRFEYYSDPDEVIVATNGGEGFETFSTSIGIDRKLNSKTLWRNEVRYYIGEDEVFPDNGAFSKNKGFFVTSLSLNF